MVKTEDDFYDSDGSRPFSGQVASGYPHQNIDNSEHHISNKVGVPEGEWYMKVRPKGVSPDELVEEVEDAGFNAVVWTSSGEQSPRVRTNKNEETSVFVW